MMSKAELEQELERDVTDTEYHRLALIELLVADQIKEADCGDETCGTCKVGVAIGSQALNAAFNAGAASVEGGLSYYVTIDFPNGQSSDYAYARFRSREMAEEFVKSFPTKGYKIKRTENEWTDPERE